MLPECITKEPKFPLSLGLILYFILFLTWGKPLILGKIDTNLEPRKNPDFYFLFLQITGKLQTLDTLLRRLKSGQHRVLIFTQMTRMLDVLEAFLNFHGHRYLRLDGTTKVEKRQVSQLF